MNYTTIFDDIIGYALETFIPMEPWFWILFFVAIIGYVYTALNSIVAAGIAIILVFGIFGATAISGQFAEVPAINQFLYIIVLLGLVLLIANIIWKRR